MKDIIKIVLSAALLFPAMLPAQEIKTLPAAKDVVMATPDYIAPVDYKMYLSGNFGEIRSNHFHSGIDIKTGGVTGKPIRAIADGYVSRIAVSPGGYGKALYVDHPGLNTTSVYGHLENFNNKINDYVTDIQYRRKSFPVDLYLERDKFPVKQGEVIAYSGNSGSSGGPHLHFEIRDRGTQDALGVIRERYLSGLDDTMPPRFLNLYSIGIDTVKGVAVHNITGRYTVTKRADGKYVPNITKLPVSKNTYFAVEVTDSKDGTANTMGIYSLEQRVDGKRNFKLTIDRVSFATTRYINSIIYYPLHRTARYDVLRTFRSPNNELRMYSGVVNSGVVTLADSLARNVEIEITDDTGHSSVLVFDVYNNGKPASAAVDGMPVKWSETYSYALQGLNLTIPAKTLYESILLKVDVSAKPEGAYSPVYDIHDQDVLLQKYMTVSIAPDEYVPRSAISKLCIVSLDRSGRKVYEGGNYKNGAMEVQTRSFGKYFIVADSIPPKVQPKFVEGADMRGQKSLSVTMTDNLSGIGSWHVDIDGQWALFEHDPKTSSIIHFFKDARYEKGKTHNMTVFAEDGRGNKTSVNTSFIY